MNASIINESQLIPTLLRDRKNASTNNRRGMDLVLGDNFLIVVDYRYSSFCSLLSQLKRDPFSSYARYKSSKPGCRRLRTSTSHVAVHISCCMCEYLSPACRILSVGKDFPVSALRRCIHYHPILHINNSEAVDLLGCEGLSSAPCCVLSRTSLKPLTN